MCWAGVRLTGCSTTNYRQAVITLDLTHKMSYGIPMFVGDTRTFVQLHCAAAALARSLDTPLAAEWGLADALLSRALAANGATARRTPLQRRGRGLRRLVATAAAYAEEACLYWSAGDYPSSLYSAGVARDLLAVICPGLVKC